MTQSRQTFKNTTNIDMFITLEPACWMRYRLKPGDLFEISFSLKCDQDWWVPLEVEAVPRGEKVDLIIFVNGDRKPEVLINSNRATTDHDGQT